VQKVVAHTEEEYNASVKILQKAGMQFAGEVSDKENEQLWQWAITREQYNARWEKNELESRS
jgi:RimJ/RimL family protein N-acetyltransferase